MHQDIVTAISKFANATITDREAVSVITSIVIRLNVDLVVVNDKLVEQ